MFPINTNFPKYEAVIPDTNFSISGGKATGTFLYGPLATKKYEIAAVGQGIHGLNINNKIETVDENGIYTTITGIKFVTTESNQITRKVWDGEKYVTHDIKVESTQIPSYKCSDFRIHTVPNLLNFTRDLSPIDSSNNIKWLDYSILSGDEKYIYGHALGKNSFIYSKSVGQSFKITYISSIGSDTETRKYTFNVDRFGHFNKPYNRQVLIVDSGCVDRNGSSSSPSTNCIITAGLPLTPYYNFKLHDFNDDGSKCLVALIVENTLGLSDNDGINSINSWPLGWLEFTFTENNSIVGATVEVKKHYSTNSGSYTSQALTRYNDGHPPSIAGDTKLREIDPLKVNTIYFGQVAGYTQSRFIAPLQVQVYPYNTLPCKVLDRGTSAYKVIRNSLGLTISASIESQNSYNTMTSDDSYILYADVGQSKIL